MKIEVQIPFEKPVIEAGKEYFLTISSTLTHDELWAKAGHEVAWEQMKLDWYKTPEKTHETANVSAPQIIEDSVKVIIKGVDFTYTFDKQLGQLKSMIYAGKELLKHGLGLNIWRAPLANEQDGWNVSWLGVNSYPGWKDQNGWQIVSQFYSAGFDKISTLPTSFNVSDRDGHVQLEIRTRSLIGERVMEQKDQYTSGLKSDGFENIYRYRIDYNGQITLNHMVIPNGKMPMWLPRIGIDMVLDSALNAVKWYGRGPQENYPDRKSGYKIGVYNTTVEAMYEPYLLPEDFGLRTDNRFVEMTDEKGVGLRFTSDRLFNFNAYNFTTDNLSKAKYTYQLQPLDGITFNFDYATSGVGCTARSIFNQYRVEPQQFEQQIVISILK